MKLLMRRPSKVVLVLLLSVCIFLSFAFSSVAVVPLAFRVRLCGIVDSDGADRTSWQASAGNWLSNIPNSVIYKKTAFDNSELAADLRSSDMFVIHTHGGADGTEIKAIDKDGNVSSLTTAMIDSWSSSSMASNDLSFIGACYSGYGGSGATNMVTALYSKGSSCVIGYRNRVHTACNYTMIKSFCSAIGAGYTISNALIYADSCVLTEHGISGNTSSRLVLGDTSVALTPNLQLIGSSSDVPLGGGAASTASVEKLQNCPISNVEEYTLVDCYYIEETGVYVSLYNKMIDNYETDDYAFTMTNDEGVIVSSGQPHKNCLDGFNPSDNFVAYCNASLSEILNKFDCLYEIEDVRIIGTTLNPGMRFDVMMSQGGFDTIETFEIWWEGDIL